MMYWSRNGNNDCNNFCSFFFPFLKLSQDLPKEQEMRFRAQLTLFTVNSHTCARRFQGLSFYCAFVSVGSKLTISSLYGVVQNSLEDHGLQTVPSLSAGVSSSFCLPDTINVQFYIKIEIKKGSMSFVYGQNPLMSEYIPYSYFWVWVILLSKVWLTMRAD